MKKFTDAERTLMDTPEWRYLEARTKAQNVGRNGAACIIGAACVLAILWVVVERVFFS